MSKISRREELELKLHEHLKRETLFDNWNPVFTCEDTGAYLRVTLKISIPGLNEESVSFESSCLFEKHVIFYESAIEEVALRAMISNMVTEIFSELANHFIATQEHIFTDLTNTLLFSSQINIERNNPKTLLLTNDQSNQIPKTRSD